MGQCGAVWGGGGGGGGIHTVVLFSRPREPTLTGEGDNGRILLHVEVVLRKAREVEDDELGQPREAVALPLLVTRLEDVRVFGSVVPLQHVKERHLGEGHMGGSETSASPKLIGDVSSKRSRAHSRI